jgi:hypothetical protein
MGCGIPAFQADFEVRLSWNTIPSAQMTINFASIHNATQTTVLPRAIRQYPTVTTPWNCAPPYEAGFQSPASHTFTFSSPVTISGSVFIEFRVYSTNIQFGNFPLFDAFWNRTSPETNPPFPFTINDDYGAVRDWQGYLCGNPPSGSSWWNVTQYFYNIPNGTMNLAFTQRGYPAQTGEFDIQVADFLFLTIPLTIPITEDQGTTWLNCNGWVGSTFTWFPGNGPFVVPLGPWSPSMNANYLATQRYRFDIWGNIKAISSPEFVQTPYRWGAGNGPAPVASAFAQTNGLYGFGEIGIITTWQ